MAEQRDFLSELNALDDDPEPIDIEQIGLGGASRGMLEPPSETRQQLEEDGTLARLAEAEASRRQEETDDAVRKSFAEAALERLFGSPQPPGEQPQPQGPPLLDNPIARTLLEFGAQRLRNLGEAEKAGIRGFQGARQSFGSGVEQYGESLGSDALKGLGSAISGEARRLTDNPLLRARIAAAKDITQENWFRDTIDYAVSAAAEGVGSSIPFFVAGAVGGPVGLAAFGYTTSVGELREELIASGITDPATVAKYAYLAAIPHAILDQATERGLIKKLAPDAAKEVRRGLLRHIIANATKEGLTEAAQRVVEITAVAHANGGEAPEANVIRQLFADIEKGTGSTIFESGVRGALPGAVFGVAEHMPEARRAAEEAAQAKVFRDRLATVESVATGIAAEAGLDIASHGSAAATVQAWLPQLNGDQLSSIAEASGIDLPAGASDDVKRGRILEHVGLAEAQERPSPRFEASALDFKERVRQEIAAIVPPDVAVRIVDRIVDSMSGRTAQARAIPDRRLIELALTAGPDKIFEYGRHEAIHILRELQLFTPAEWATLVTNAYARGADRLMTTTDEFGTVVSSPEIYRQTYRQHLAAQGLRPAELEKRLGELMDQEAVATLAQSWERGEIESGSAADKLFYRARKIIEAIRNALRGLGFQTADDVFEKVFTGKIAARHRVEPGTAQRATPAAVSTEAAPAVTGWTSAVPARVVPKGARPKTIGTTRSRGLDAPERGLSALAAELNATLGLTTRHGRISPGLKAAASRAGGEAAGQFDTTSGVARIAIPNDIATLAHEGGHALEVRGSTRAPLEAIKQRFVKELTGIDRAPPNLLSEMFAEWFAKYVTQPASARKSAPQFYAAFEQMLDAAEPGMREKLVAVQEGYQALLKASPVGALRSRVQSTVKPSLLQRLKRNVADKGWGASIADQWYVLYTALIDAKHPMKRAVAYLKDLAADNLGLSPADRERVALKAANDPYKLWRLTEHTKVWATATLQYGVRFKGEVDPTGPSFHEALIEAFGGAGRSVWNREAAELFGSYLIARRMLAEFDRFDQGALDRPPDVLMDRASLSRAREEMEKAHPEFARAASLLYQFNRNLLRLKWQAGFLSDDLYNDLKSRVDYVPLNRIMDEDAPSQQMKAQGRNKRLMVHRFRGSTRDFINPLESIVQDVYATHARIALNDVIGAMDRLARAAGPGGGSIAERLPPNSVKGVVVDVRELMRRAARELNESDAQALHELIDDLFDQDASAEIFRATPTEEKGEPIVYLWEKGKRIPIRLGDDRIGKDIFAGIVAMGQQNTDIVMDVAALFARGFRFGVTKAPAYIMVNFLRDQLATWVLSKDFTPIVTGGKGLMHAIADDATAQRYKAFGGIAGIESTLIDTAARQHDVLSLRRRGISAAPTTFQSILRTMEITEAASRMGHFERAYQRALADGFSKEEAAIEAAYAVHDVLDFSRHGAKMAAAVRIIAFLNSSLQGLDAAVRTIRGERDTRQQYRELASPFIKAATGQPLSLAEKEALPNSARIWVKMAVIGMLGVALAALYRDDDEYEEFNDYMKATHWFFKVGGKWVRIPKPFELAALSNLFEAAFDRYWKQDERAYVRFLESLRHTMMAQTEIQAVATLGYLSTLPVKAWEWLTGTKDPYAKNKGDSTVPIHMQALPPEMQFTAYTSEFSRMLGAIMKLSPAELDRFFQQTFATLGRDVLALSDQTLPALNQALGGSLPGVSTKPRADKSLEDWWILSRFMRREARASLSGQIFWQQMSQSGGKYVAAAAGYKDLVKSGNTQAAKELLDSLPDDQRVYAILEAHFKENDQDLHPLNRARQVTGAASDIRRSLLLDRLFKTAVYRGAEPEKIELSPSKQRVVNEILEDLTMREQRNALIVLGHPGWRHKRILATDGLLRELQAAAPEVAEEIEVRLTKGRNKVYPFAGVRSEWPRARAALLKEGADANLVGHRADARYASPPGYTGPLEMMATGQ